MDILTRKSKFSYDDILKQVYQAFAYGKQQLILQGSSS